MRAWVRSRSKTLLARAVSAVTRRHMVLLAPADGTPSRRFSSVRGGLVGRRFCANIRRAKCPHPATLAADSTCITGSFAGTLETMACRGCHAVRRDRRRFRARQPGVRCASRRSRPGPRPFVRRAPTMGRAASCPSTATCGWPTRARSAASSSGSAAPDAPTGSPRTATSARPSEGPSGNNCIILNADASRRASLLVAYIHPVCALLAPRRAGASTPRMAHLFPDGP